MRRKAQNNRQGGDVEEGRDEDLKYLENSFLESNRHFIFCLNFQSFHKYPRRAGDTTLQHQQCKQT